MWLDCGPHGLLELSRIGPSAVIAKFAREIPPCFADLIVCVDGQSLSVRVKLTNGFVKGRRAARALIVDDALPI